jgi:hypothetical protein
LTKSFLTTGQGFRGLLDYLENQKDAKLIGGNMGNSNARALAREFKISRQLNPEADRVVYHASLSLPQGEQLLGMWFSLNEAMGCSNTQERMLMIVN